MPAYQLMYANALLVLFLPQIDAITLHHLVLLFFWRDSLPISQCHRLWPCHPSSVHAPASQTADRVSSRCGLCSVAGAPGQGSCCSSAHCLLSASLQELLAGSCYCRVCRALPLYAPPEPSSSLQPPLNFFFFPLGRQSRLCKPLLAAAQIVCFFSASLQWPECALFWLP